MSDDPTRQFKRREYDRSRASSRPSRRWYKSAAWRRKAKAQLRDFPFCAMCEALDPPKVEAADIADHVIPHRDDYERFWRGELQSLCKPCHDGPKQRLEARGFAPGVGEDGWPADPNHPFNRGGSI